MVYIAEMAWELKISCRYLDELGNVNVEKLHIPQFSYFLVFYIHSFYKYILYSLFSNSHSNL